MENGKYGAQYPEGRYSTAHGADTYEFMFWSVHDHPDGRNRTGSGRTGGAEGRGGLHVHRDRPGGMQLGPLRTAYDMVGAAQQPAVHGQTALSQGAEQRAVVMAGRLRRGAVVAAGGLGDDHVPGAHPGGEAGDRSRWRSRGNAR